MNPTERKNAAIARLGKVNQLDYIGITLASPDAIRSWSKGEVRIRNDQLRTFNRIKAAFFCERHLRSRQRTGIVSSGKYKRSSHRARLLDLAAVGSDPGPRAPWNAWGHIRARRADLSYLVLQVHALAHRLCAGRDRPQTWNAHLISKIISFIDPGNTPPHRKNQLLSEHPNIVIVARNFTGAEAFLAKMGAEARARAARARGPGHRARISWSSAMD